ncbi:MAG: ECF transporter S component [Lachnospiraceae bacterium]|nr:ECF transporter S component [Lachnospiraceae bacterium]
MNDKTKTLVGIGLFTAIVIVLQALSISIRFGIFTVTLVLIPIVVGAALYGWKAGAWLGFVFSVVVLITDAGAFLAVNVPGTVITVLLKGTMAGLVAGMIYLKLSAKNRYLAVVVAAVSAPIVNTGIFLIGCRLFFYATIGEWAAAAGFASAGLYMIVGFVGLNFIVETVINVALIPVIFRLINLGRRSNVRSVTA